MPYLPKKIEKKVKLRMYPEQGEAYEETMMALNSEISTDVEDESFTIAGLLALFMRAQQVTSYPGGMSQRIQGTDKDDKRKVVPFPNHKRSIKIDWTIDFLENRVEEESDKKTIVFTRFRETAQEISRLLTEKKMEHALMMGGLSDAEFDEQRLLFKKSPTCNILVSIIESGGTALNLPEADTTIFVDSHYSSIKMTQAIDRMRDDNEGENGKRVFYLVCEGTIDEDIHKAFHEKWREQRFIGEALLAIQQQTGVSISPDTINQLKHNRA